MEAFYIAENKVVGVQTLEQKTPMDNEILSVEFENGQKKLMSKKTYDLVVTEVASDATTLQSVKFRSMVPAIIAVIAEFDLEAGEINKLLQDVAGSIDNSFNRAVSFALTKDDREYIPGYNPVFKRSLLEVDEIIKSIPDVAPVPTTETDGTV